MDPNRLLNALTAFGTSWVLWLLVALSVLGVAVIIERCVYLALSRDDPSSVRRELRRLLGAGQVDFARRRLEESPSPAARVAASGLSSDDAASAEERMSGERELVRLQMERNLAFLGTLASNAPFVGLLGTVIGIIRAFHALEEQAGQVSAGLMAEIGEALVATAVGLLVALPAVAFFNMFQRVIRTRISQADALASEVLAYFKSAHPGAGPAE